MCFNKKKILFILDNLISRIDSIIYNNSRVVYCASFVENLFDCYVFFTEYVGVSLPFHTIEEYFRFYDLEGENDYKKFCEIKASQTRKFFKTDFKSRMTFVLDFTKTDIYELITNVLNDSKEDPHYSAVYANKMINYYIDLMNDLGYGCVYKDAESFIKLNGFLPGEYIAFEEKRKKEMEYYVGETQ